MLITEKKVVKKKVAAKGAKTKGKTVAAKKAAATKAAAKKETEAAQEDNEANKTDEKAEETTPKKIVKKTPTKRAVAKGKDDVTDFIHSFIHSPFIELSPQFLCMMRPARLA